MPFLAPLSGILFGFAGTAAGAGGFAAVPGLVTAGNIAIGATVASTAMSAKAQSDAGKTEKKWLEYNAAITEQQAEAFKQSALDEEKTHRKAGQRHLARMLVEGYDPLMLEETAGELEKDALMIRRGGTLGEQKLKSQAGMERGKGAFARRTGRWRSGATLLSGGTQAAGLYGTTKGYW
jgi:hypothetical protein